MVQNDIWRILDISPIIFSYTGANQFYIWKKFWGTKYNSFFKLSVSSAFHATSISTHSSLKITHCEYLHSHFLILWQWSWFFNKTEKVIYLCLRMSHKNTLWQDKLFWYILILNLKAIKVWRLCAWYKCNWQYQMLNGT